MSTSVQQLVPAEATAGIADLLALVQRSGTVPPFHAARVDFVADLALRLGRRSAAHPEARALAYWMRKAELSRMRAAFEELGQQRLTLQPRGTIFHIPPANVDTLFVYTWAIATLTGNRNVVRLSARMTDQTRMILAVIREVLVDHPDVASSSTMISYGHDDHITAAISRCADVRVVWGGNDTINRIRSVPLPPHATELTFADRFSMAAIDASAYLRLDDEARDRLAERFFNDMYFFDQMGCSSARLLIWVGDSTAASPDFRGRVRATVMRKQYPVSTSAAIAKLGQGYRGMITTEAVDFDNENALTVLRVEEFPDVRGEFCGGGFLYEMEVSTLSAITPHVRRADQTLTTFGFEASELRSLVHVLAGRGIDRIVPIGKALDFDRYWDGYDLLAEFTRKVVIEVGSQ